MNWIKFFIVIAAMVSCTSPENEDNKPFASRYVMETDELKAILNSDTIQVLDLRKHEDFMNGHIPGAINLWRTEIQHDSFPYDGMLAGKKQLEAVLGSKGIRSDHFLVLYDDRASCEAARLWWILDHYGFDRMAILNGGFVSWSMENELSMEVANYPPTEFELPAEGKGHRLITLAEMSIGEGTTILDTRSVDEYSGKEQKSGSFDRGRIPGSVHIDWMMAVNELDHRFKTQEELTEIYTSLGITPEDPVFTY